MRRSLAGVLLLAAGVFLALAASSLWLGRVAFTPSDDNGVTRAILGDEDIRSEIASVVAGVNAPELNQSPSQLKEFVEQVAVHPDGAALMTQFVGDAHARLIGELDETVRITAAEQVVIVRDERVALLPPITLPVQEVGAVAFVNTVVGWIAVIGGGLGILSLITGLILRPERGEFTLAVGIGFVTFGVLMIVLGYLVPLAVLPALSDATWMGVFTRLANHWRTITFVIAVVAIGLAAIVMFGTAGLRQRRQWSTPLAVGRYREHHSWSR